MEAYVRRALGELRKQSARGDGNVHLWRTYNVHMDQDGTFGPEIDLTITGTYVIPVFPTGRMLLKHVFIPMRVEDPPTQTATGKVQLGLYRVIQPTNIALSAAPKVGRHEFEFVQEFSVSYYSGTLANASSIAPTAVISVNAYTRVVGTLENARILAPGVQYAIVVRPLEPLTGPQGIRVPATALLVDAPSYSYGASANNAGPLPSLLVPNARIRTPPLTLLSPQGAYILGG